MYIHGGCRKLQYLSADTDASNRRRAHPPRPITANLTASHGRIRQPLDLYTSQIKPSLSLGVAGGEGQTVEDVAAHGDGHVG